MHKNVRNCISSSTDKKLAIMSDRHKLKLFTSLFLFSHLIYKNKQKLVKKMANINSAYITYKTQLVKRKTNKSTTFQQIQWVKGTSGLVALQTRVQFEHPKRLGYLPKAFSCDKSTI